jgi:hypothetical protein
MKDDNVIEILVGIGLGEIRRPSQQRRIANAFAATVIAHNEFLMEDLRIQISLNVHTTAQ